MYFKYVRTLGNDEPKEFKSIIKAVNSQQAERILREEAAKRGENLINLKLLKKADSYEQLVPRARQPIKPKVDRFKKIRCEYCKEWIPRNGAAQFSHLKKHAVDLCGPTIISKLTSIRDIKEILKKRKRSKR